jgi:hypothetical protein
MVDIVYICRGIRPGVAIKGLNASVHFETMQDVRMKRRNAEMLLQDAIFSVLYVCHLQTVIATVAFELEKRSVLR